VAAAAVKIQTWPLERLIPYARNPRTHPEAQIARLMALIREVGFVGAIVVRDGVIGKGHGSMQAVRRLYEAGELLYPAPGEKGKAKPFKPGHVPVLDVSGWSDAQFRAWVIADNRIAEDAGWDENLLRLELDELKDLGFDVGLTGFEPDELDKAMHAASSGVTLVPVSELQDRFWISLRGPLKQQAKVLKALRESTKGLEGVDVELGTTGNDPL
jgi:hypothetical protein